MKLYGFCRIATIFETHKNFYSNCAFTAKKTFMWLLEKLVIGHSTTSMFYKSARQRPSGYEIHRLSGGRRPVAVYPPDEPPPPARPFPVLVASHDSLFTRFSLSTRTIRNTLPRILLAKLRLFHPYLYIGCVPD